MQITHRPVAFSTVQTKNDFPGVYQLAHICQLDMDGTVGISLNIRRSMPNGAYDIEIGSDLAIVRDAELRHADSFQPLARARVATHTDGKTYLLLSYPVVIGFAARGAQLADGSPHPHAGTGFGYAHISGVPCTPDGAILGTGVIKREESAGIGLVELSQYSYDGKEFRIESTELFDYADFIRGDWTFCGAGLSNPISDGADGFFCGMVAKPTGSPLPPRAGLANWKREDGKWQVVSFVPVAPYGSYESSVVRDRDGSLLMTARGCHEYLFPDSPEAMADVPNMNDIRVWRSADNGDTWTLVCNEKGLRCCSTVAIGITPHGQPFIVSHPYCTRDHMGRQINVDAHSDWMRESLALWPLSDDRSTVKGQIIAKAPLDEFPPPTYGGTWWIDHPQFANVVLSDGKLHTTFACRVLEFNEAMGRKPPTPYTGAYIEEITD